MFSYHQEDFFDFAYRRARGLATTRDHIDWADALLVAGCNVPSIAELASYVYERDPERSEVESAFLECVAELGLTLVADSDEAFEKFIAVISIRVCEQILTNEITPKAGMRRLLEFLEDNDDEPLILWMWLDLENDLGPFRDNYVTCNEGLDLTDYDACVRATAAQYIALSKLNLPERFPWVWQCHQCGFVSEESTFTAESARLCPGCQGPLALRNMRFFTNRDQLASGRFGK